MKAFFCVGLGSLAILALAVSLATAADKVRWYETRGIIVNADTLVDWSKNSYWSANLRQQVELKLVRGGPEDEAGQNALFSAVSAWVSAAGSQARTEGVLVLEREEGSTAQIAARVDLTPSEVRPRLELEPFLIDETIAVRVEAPAARRWRPSFGFLQSRFPDGIEAFCGSKTDICAALFRRLEQLVAEPGSRLVTVADGSAQYTFHASIQASADPAKRLTVRYLADLGPTVVAPPAGHEAKSKIDVELERLQNAGSKDRLGRLRGFEDLSPDERAAAKYATLTYFQSGTRDAEADIALPTRAAGLSLFTLRLLPDSNDVSVEALGAVERLTRCDLRRTPGFPGHGSVGEVREWLHRRYPAIDPTGETPDELIANTRALIDAEAGDRKWFSRNYRLAVLGPKAADRRLAETHGMPGSRRGGLKRFSSEELHVLECVLETMGDRLLQRVRDSVLVRQTTAEEDSPFGDRAQEVTMAGHTFTRTVTVEGANPHREVHSTVVIYDAALLPDTRFVGWRSPNGRVYAYPPLAQVFAHEFGHVVGPRASLEAQFYEWVTELKVQPFTRYAASAPQGEFFPEAFSLYLLDPGWFKTDYPALYERARAYASRPALH